MHHRHKMPEICMIRGSLSCKPCPPTLQALPSFRVTADGTHLKIYRRCGIDEIWHSESCWIPRSFKQVACVFLRGRQPLGSTDGIHTPDAPGLAASRANCFNVQLSSSDLCRRLTALWHCSSCWALCRCVLSPVF